jgi:heterodisulfide reductase subunit E
MSGLTIFGITVFDTFFVDYRITIISAIIAVAIFFVGMYLLLKKWGEGSQAYGEVSQGGSAWGFLKTLINSIRKESASTILKIIVLDILLQRRTFRVSKLRWLMHILIFYGWLGLAFFSVVVATSCEFYGAFSHHPELYKNAWQMLEPVNAFLSYMLVGGIAIAFGRRLVSRDVRIRSDDVDWIFIALLIIVVASGFYAQYVRDLSGITFKMSTAEYPPGYYGSFGNLFVIFHEVFSLFAMVAYIPFSKFMHIFAAPLTILVNGGGK